MKKNNKKGFTLAELLIVVAIIAVLTAIAIPVFTAQLEKARQGTDLANLRSAYAEAQVNALDSKPSADGSYTGESTMTVKITSNGTFDKLDDPKVGSESMTGKTLSGTVKVKCVTDKDGKTTVTFPSASA